MADEQGGLWDRVLDLLDRAARQHHVLALRDGMIAAVPIILVGSIFLLLGSQGDILDRFFPGLAGAPAGQWYKAHVGEILIPYRLTMGMLALYVAFTVATALARQYDLPPVPQGLGAVAALLLTDVPRRLPLEEGGPPFWMLPMTLPEGAGFITPLGPGGLFLAILLAILMVEVSRLLLRPGRKQEAQAPQGGIPPAVLAAFASFGPILVVVTLVWWLRYGLDIDLNAALLVVVKPVTDFGDTLQTVVGANVLLHLFGVAGIHGISLINAVMLPIWQNYVAANAEAHVAGQALPYVTAYPFYQWFVWVGGAGVTLAPNLLLFFSRSPHLRYVGRISLVPALFNVNEPLLFGLPVVANPLLAIPFILAPVACGTLAYLTIEAGLVNRPFIEVPWVLPCFLGAPLSTQDLSALALLAANLALSGAIWFPFLKAYERRLLAAPTPPSAEAAPAREG
jgi:PTS system cellobiose-specific IIC component